ncbi:preprotein translocase subunit SecE [Candidatus Laterigemmans baculatus]|uniref:preprotein translocase subunit SecE n=1 Tax=Candidatus Laterigemmans baculatus TaxID=2770505 RepID=UPI0013DC4F87|nr:preprotein translocase subunit SecE [Candidatus Laterigemmans baculatus]
MSREVAGASPPLTTELFSGSVYKRNQGRLVRQLTCLAIWVVVALGAWRLSVFLRDYFPTTQWLEFAIPAVFLLAGVWIGYRLVNWPRFADFLIAVEAEMNKVSWPSRGELIRASIVVIFTIFFLAMILFVFDIVWQWIFSALGVTI